MANLYLTNRVKDKGLLTEQDKYITDFTSLGGRNTNATGYLILSDDEHIYIPDTLIDRQSIIDNLITTNNNLKQTLDTLKAFKGTVLVDGLPINVILDAGYKTTIDNIKSTIDNNNSTLSTLKDNLQ